MDIPLSEDLKQFIENQVNEGRYPSGQAVVEAALRRMRDEEPIPAQSAIHSHPPNATALAILQAVMERQRDRSASDSSRTQDYIREARSGGMYGHGDDAVEPITEPDHRREHPDRSLRQGG
jgi:putative addiction module CopG family antidote